VTEAADLHLHTTHSDGSLSPSALVAAAVEARLAAIAVTDHDTVAGVAEAAASAESGPLRVIAGVELAAEDEGGGTHVVGLFIDPANPALVAVLRRKREERQVRAAAMVRRLAELGRPVDLDAVLADRSPGSVGRMHLAEAMQRAGHVPDIQAAFDDWLGEGERAYVPRRRFTVAGACDLIRGAGGLPVLAHPKGLTRADVARLAAAGIAALEAYNPAFGPGWSRHLRQWARELSLGISGGSDYHGPGRPGVCIGAVRVPMEYIEDLERRLL